MKKETDTDLKENKAADDEFNHFKKLAGSQIKLRKST